MPNSLLARAFLLFALLLNLPAQALPLPEAEVAVSDAAQFPAEAPLQLQTLPDTWAESRPDFSGAVWYRFRFAAAGSPPPLAVYIPRLCSSATVRLNNVTLLFQGQPGRLTEPVGDHCQQPLFLQLPPEILRQGGNVLDVRVAAYAKRLGGAAYRAGMLAAPEVGPASELKPRYVLAKLLRQTVPKLLSAALLLAMVWLAVLARSRPEEHHLRYLAGAMGVWILLGAHLWLDDVSWPHQWIEMFLISLLPCLGLNAVQFLLCRLEWQDIRVTWVLRAECLLAPISLLAVGPTHYFGMCSFWFALLGLQVLGAFVWHVRTLDQRAIDEEPAIGETVAGAKVTPQARQARFEHSVMRGFLYAVIACIVLETLSQQGSLPADWPLPAPLLVPLLLLGMALHASLDVVRARARAEAEHREISQQVQERIAAAEHGFNLQAEQRLEQVTERERKRIAADLHDDLGAKLLTIVHTSESDRISSLAREALEEMRLSVRGLTGKPVQLLDALGDWRAEVVSRLAQANILAEWKTGVEDLVYTLPARAYVQTTRIMRESISNIIKHSGATNCVITCSVIDGDFQVIIQDNGRGIPTESETRIDGGHGMASMKSRAKQMHGQCLVESGPGWGTVIRLTIPL